MRRILLLFAVLCLPLYLIGCAGTTSVTRTITVAVSPTAASVPAGQTQAFIAMVTGTPNTGVTWTLTQGGAACSPGCGTISPTSTTSGAATTYIAPATPPTQAGAITLTATSAANTAISASATITITTTQSVGITISPMTASVGVGATQAFTATVTGTNNTGVTWTLAQNGAACSACGTISPTSSASGQSVTYTAPSTLPSNATVTVTATSVADTTKSASATVTITQPTVGITVSPGSATVVVAQTQAFIATVTGTNTLGVNWTLSQGGAACSPGCGTIAPTSTTSGAPATYTAPATVPAIAAVTVTATSAADPTKSTSATVTVTGQTTGVVAVSPSTATVEVFAKQQFTATINGQPSTAVTWQVNTTTGGGAITGAISASGLYSAPHSISSGITQANGAPTFVTVTAVSTANSSNSGSATVTITVPGQSPERAPIKLGTSGSNALDFNTSGGNTTCCGGTLGSLVASGATQYILSADHVLARSGAGAPGEAILQPGTIDTNCSTQGTTTVANLTLGSFANETGTVDAAIAQVVSGAVDPAGNILLLGSGTDTNGVPLPGAPNGGTGVPATPSLVGTPVAKSGRTTGLTCSTVTSTNLTTPVDYTPNCDGTGTKFTVLYNNQITVAQTDPDGTDFSIAGDSGSLIVTQSNASPVALFYAASSMDSVGNPVSDVLNFFASNGITPTFVGAARTAPVIGCTLPAPQAATATRLAVQKTVPSAQALAHAAADRDAHGAELLGHPEVQAVGVGASYDNSSEAAILLFVTKGQPRTNLPAAIDGVRTRIVEGDSFSQHGLLSAEESSALEQFAPPPQLVYSISEAEGARAKVVHGAHVDELMKMSGVQGVGITSSVDSPGEAALMIFLIDGVPHPAIPPVIDGLRTRIRVSTRFRAGFEGAGSQRVCRVPRPKGKSTSPQPKSGSSSH